MAPLRSDICYATQNRQDAVKELGRFLRYYYHLRLSSLFQQQPPAGNRQQMGMASYIVDTAAELDCAILKGKQKVGLSSGASVPRYLVDEIIDKIKTFDPASMVHEFNNPEKNIVFPVLQFKE